MRKIKQNRPGDIILKLLTSLLLALLIAGYYYVHRLLYGDFYCTLKMPGLIFVISATVLFVFFLLVKKRIIISTAMLVFIVIAASVTINTASMEMVEKNDIYKAPDTKSELYSGRKVLLITPHQDDEINQMGGVIEELVKYGSHITVVFGTNGDYDDNAQQRLDDAQRALEVLGVSRENVIFLGYGDNWQDGHLWDAADNEVKKSHAGYSKTYAPQGFTVWREGRDYTKENYIEDIRDCILEEKADIICCVDYDEHVDHRALSMAFEKAMADILANTDYRPLVLKSFAYSTAWQADKDYSTSENLASTLNINGQEYMVENNIYLWKDRLRLPVSASSLSRDIENSLLYKALLEHRATTYIGEMAAAVINSDKVFWERETGSLLYDSKIEVSSGQGEKLKDFALCYTDQVERELPTQGTWTADSEDELPTAKLVLKEKEDIKRICLYDNPSFEHDVLKVSIKFDDGSQIVCGPLLPNGSATEITVDKSNVGSFEVQILEKKGEEAGLTEIEAYKDEKENAFPFIKITDSEGCFAYDWRTHEKINTFDIYSPVISEALSAENYVLQLSNKKCDGEISDGKITVKCPEGERCTVTVTHKTSGLEDAIELWHPGRVQQQMLDKGNYLLETLKLNYYHQMMTGGSIKNEGIWSAAIGLALEKMI